MEAPQRAPIAVAEPVSSLAAGAAVRGVAAWSPFALWTHTSEDTPVIHIFTQRVRRAWVMSSLQRAKHDVIDCHSAEGSSGKVHNCSVQRQVHKCPFVLELRSRGPFTV
jgi:hypothetical protein